MNKKPIMITEYTIFLDGISVWVNSVYPKTSQEASVFQSKNTLFTTIMMELPLTLMLQSSKQKPSSFPQQFSQFASQQTLVSMETYMKGTLWNL